MEAARALAVLDNRNVLPESLPVVLELSTPLIQKRPVAIMAASAAAPFRTDLCLTGHRRLSWVNVYAT